MVHHSMASRLSDMRDCEHEIKKFVKPGVFDTILSLVLAGFFASSADFIKTGTCHFDLAFVYSFVCIFVLFMIATTVVRRIIVRVSVHSAVHSSSSVTGDTSRRDTHSRHRPHAYFTRFSEFMARQLRSGWGVILVGLFIFVLWLPYLIVLYPGTLVNDIWGQLQQIISATENGGFDTSHLWDHHPIFSTLLYGYTILPMARAWGNWHLAIFVFVLVQSVLTALTFAYTARYAVTKLNLSARIVTTYVLVIALMPMFPLSTQTVTKDSIFAPIYVIFFVLFIEVVRSKGSPLQSWRFVLAVALTSVFMSITKRGGIYVVLLSYIVALLVVKAKKIMAIIIALIVAMGAFMFVGYPAAIRAAGVSEGSRQDAYAFMFQQTARTIKTHGTAGLTQDDINALNKVIGGADGINGLGDKYRVTNADPLKEYEDHGRTSADYNAYVRVWIKMGLQHPKTYIMAAIGQVSGWFSWSEYVPLTTMDWHDQLNPEKIPQEVPNRGITKNPATQLKHSLDNLYETPGIRILVTYGLFASLLPAFLVGSLMRTKRLLRGKYYIAMAPLLVNLLTGCYLAPVSTGLETMRYLYPVTFTLPLCIVWMMFALREEMSTTEVIADAGEETSAEETSNKETSGKEIPAQETTEQADFHE